MSLHNFLSAWDFPAFHWRKSWKEERDEKKKEKKKKKKKRKKKWGDYLYFSDKEKVAKTLFFSLPISPRNRILEVVLLDRVLLGFLPHVNQLSLHDIETGKESLTSLLTEHSQGKPPSQTAGHDKPRKWLLSNWAFFSPVDTNWAEGREKRVAKISAVFLKSRDFLVQTPETKTKDYNQREI